MHLHCPDCVAVVALPTGISIGPDATPMSIIMQLHGPVCPERRVKCECGSMFTQAQLAAHKVADCLAATQACAFCNVSFKRGALAAHEVRLKASRVCVAAFPHIT